jgi:protein-L-isoaspartate(D-aspartate) O-methyltransferase
MDYIAARHVMVENQIRTNRVTDPLVIEAMATVPREAFVPKALADVAYVDEAVPLGGGRYVMEPLVIARLLQAAEVTSTDVVLDVGAGTGYAAALLAAMASTVVALEPDADLAARARETLARLEAATVSVVEGPLEEGCPAEAPYDVIFVNGAVADVPRALTDQLADGGRLVTVVAPADPAFGMGWGTLFTRLGGAISHTELFDAGTPILPGFARAPAFSF